MQVFLDSIAHRQQEIETAWRSLIHRVADGENVAGREALKILRDANKSEFALHYLRFGRFFVLLATHGEHRFFRDEPHFKDARRDPIRFTGYSISLKRGRDGRLHPSVRIHPDEYRKLKAYLLDLAPHRTIENLAAAFAAVPFERYAPVRRQLLNIWRAANRAREQAGFEPAPLAILRLRRRVVRAFPEQGEPVKAAA